MSDSTLRLINALANVVTALVILVLVAGLARENRRLRQRDAALRTHIAALAHGEQHEEDQTP